MKHAQRPSAPAGKVIVYARDAYAAGEIARIIGNLAAQRGMNPMKAVQEFMAAFIKEYQKRGLTELHFTVTSRGNGPDGTPEVKITLKGNGKEISLFMENDGLYYRDEVSTSVQRWDAVLESPQFAVGVLMDSQWVAEPIREFMRAMQEGRFPDELATEIRHTGEPTAEKK